VRVNQLVCPDYSTTLKSALSYVVNVGNAYGLALPANVVTALTAANLPIPSPYANAFYNSTNPVTALSGPGVFRNNLPMSISGTIVQPRPISLSDIKSPSQRPMLSERTYRNPMNESDTPSDADRVWNVYATSTPSSTDFTSQQIGNTNHPYLSPAELGFSWPQWPPASANVPVPITTLFAPPPRMPQSSIHPGVSVVTFCDGHVEALPDATDCTVYDSSPIP
jgi:prepilin-type processing-associated H-X9-DG protein